MGSSSLHEHTVARNGMQDALVLGVAARATSITSGAGLHIIEIHMLPLQGLVYALMRCWQHLHAPRSNLRN
jgi:hypothetical protein